MNVSGATADHVVINEVYYDVEGSDDGEFVELYNPTNDDINLSGWYFGDEETPGGGESWNPVPDCTVIKPHGYLLIAKDIATFVEQWGFVPTYRDADGIKQFQFR
ncbi:MAG: hypothetical protein A2161_13130 [Candidatus Schekmanbacteria bacterium RBG_13_48_7]|uniref:LTD domain-containing protein n=1 Tax=Candidatus Schekmanbacteria bacterium RBG_13_48_7 TaxID=1817878 RepID=A0A1F7RL64_9BACT|nr:MAG: hypothetical protein A2161_13130 [Candidatus Schekmanbacteria bacterium RBG_13_48_7]